MKEQFTKNLTKILITMISYLPIFWVRAIGGLVGICAYKLSKRTTTRLKNNLLKVNLATPETIDKIALEVAKEQGKTLVETITIAWCRSTKYNASLIKYSGHFDEVTKAISSGKPVVFLTPHLGNFEIALKMTAYHFPHTKFSVLYKPSKLKWFDQLMAEGRNEENIKAVPTSFSGVSHLLKVLKNNGCIGILPDSVASGGDGAWVDFMGQKVFATTLSAKMCLFEDASIFIVSSARIKGGFDLDFMPFKPTSNDYAKTTQEIYTVIEKMVLQTPTQYYWSYDRFRTPKHAQAKA